jgi:RNA polymerase sigma factor (sigma-70 family)
MSALFRTTRAADFDRLYRRHAPSVYRYAFAVLGNRADAEDVTQQTFLNAYRAIEHGTKPRKAENWLLRIAHNEVRRHFRTNGKTVEVEYDERHAQPAPEGSGPGFADIVRALQQLPPTQRSALVMREFEGRSYAEIAEVLEVTQSALETLIFRARRALAEQLEDALTCTEAEQALSRRLDGRLPRREARRLKVHLHECALCVRFAAIQKRQRSLLKGLSIMPIPASLFLFRGEPAAAALGGSSLTVGGSAAIGGGAATGLVAKAAAVTAAAAVAGGVGYGVTKGPLAVTKPEREVAHAAVVQPRGAVRQEVGVMRAKRGSASAPSTRADIRRPRKKERELRVVRAQPSAKDAPAEKVAPGRARGHEKPAVPADVRPATRRAAKAATLKPKTRPRPNRGKRLGPVKRADASPRRPPRVLEKPAHPLTPEPPLPANAAAAGPKK